MAYPMTTFPLFMPFTLMTTGIHAIRSVPSSGPAVTVMFVGGSGGPEWRRRRGKRRRKMEEGEERRREMGEEEEEDGEEEGRGRGGRWGGREG